MSALDYFLPHAADDTDLSVWASILPMPVSRLCTNLFDDAFLLDTAGTVHILDRAGCSSECVAASEEDFWRGIAEDSAGWQLRLLADECRRAGMLLAEDQCYAFTTPTVLGGEYAVQNVWVAPWREWFAFTAELFQQIKGLPDGATVSMKVVD